jgi:signal transduction histidine kinase
MSLLARAHQELRVLAERLHPPLLDEMGLPTALRGLVLRVGKTRLTLEISSDFPRFEAEVETAAFKLIDEALTSVFAGNLMVEVQLSHDEDGTLHVALSGVPLEASETEPAIARLSLRARGVGGRLRVHRASTRLKLEAVFAKGREQP